jgi:hypothetical protein
LYTDYRWTINEITLAQNRAVVEATLQSSGMATAVNVPYRVTLEQAGGQWQIAKAEQVAPVLRLPPPWTDIAERNGVVWPFPARS